MSLLNLQPSYVSFKKKKNLTPYPDLQGPSDLAPANLSDFFYHSLPAHRAPAIWVSFKCILTLGPFPYQCFCLDPLPSPHHFRISSLHSDPCLSVTFSDTPLVPLSKVANQSLSVSVLYIYYLVSCDIYCVHVCMYVCVCVCV